MKAEAFSIYDKIHYYTKLRGLPYTARENEVINFLNGIRLYKDDIVF